MLRQSSPLLILSALLCSSAFAQVELPGERSMYAKVYQQEDGQRQAVISSGPAHYLSNGIWEDINTTIAPGTNGYENLSNVIQSYFPGSVNGSGSMTFVVNGQDQINVNSEKQLVLVDNQGVITSVAASPGTSFAVVTDNTIRYPEIYPDVSDEFVVTNGQIKNNVLLSAVPACLNNVTSGYFGYTETMQLPQGWTIRVNGDIVNSMTAASLSVVDANGNDVLMIPAPIIFDNYGLQPDGLNMVDGRYLLNTINGDWTITTLVPVQWLKDANTAYPVSIDPTIVIAGTTGGWQSPNNFVDNPGFVFLGVCCSNLTHRAWIKFNTTAIPDTMCITNVELQVNVTSVAAAGAELVLINDVTGAFGPYGGINAAAYTDFGNGFYNSFTITTTGVYGYYALGATANTLLQSQLPGNWFQVAMRFNNEPSTVYKIISGTTSYIRVTYSPCAPLPVELVSFNATCNNEQVDLFWTTASETNNEYFTIERTSDGRNFEHVGTIPGAGYSDQLRTYSFTDTKPMEGTSYYRIRQTDFNGRTEYFNVLPVSCDNNEVLSVYPNPATDQVIISLSPQSQLKTLYMYDVSNRLIAEEAVNGRTKIELNLSPYENGVYILKAGADVVRIVKE